MILTNVNLVLENQVVKGSIELVDGKIQSFSDTQSQLPQAVNGDNGWLLPGLIELHTDNLEKNFSPRPKVNWPAFSAMAAHDAQLIAAGITTVLDAVALGDLRDGGARHQNLDKMINTVVETELRGVNRAQHFLHLRCEVPYQSTLDILSSYVDLPQVQLVSLMDHAPGQRQFVDMQKYREYYQGKYSISDSDMIRFEAEQRANSERWSTPNRNKISNLCRQRNISMASHDDATYAHVAESQALGMAIAEFPTTIEAATASHELGLKVMMGAPNIVRGGSHSGNIAAHELATLGVLDILSSDYYPASLLDAIFKVAEDESNTFDLARSTQLSTLNPAIALGLDDRGVISEGKRADLILAHKHQDNIYTTRVWREGNIVF